MNLKVRFALLFTSFVAIMLIISSATIYFLYSSYREQDFFNKVAYEGNEVYQIFNEIKKPDQRELIKLFRSVHDFSIFHGELYIVDSLGKVVFRFPENIPIKIPSFPKNKAINELKYNFTDGNNIQHTVLYKPVSKSFVFVAGYDELGYEKLDNLSVILSFVFLGSFFITGIISFLFVKEAIKPIVRLSEQMSKTNEGNLSDRLALKPSNDEINTIAKNFNSMLERLQKAFDTQKSFVRHASHELRTPLAVMLSQTEAALNRINDAEGYRSVLESLKEYQQYMVELTNSLLLISQYESIKNFPNWPYIRIDELLYETISTAKKMFADIQVDLSFEKIPDDDAALMFKGNESLLKSAFMNLIKNAYNYSDDKKVQIVIIPGIHTVGVAFKNHGSQLSTDEVEKMNIPFFRGENSINKKGFGLGLSIVDKILILHKGKMTYKKKNDKLNIFYIQFPSN